MSNIVNVEVDLDLILTAKDKVDALYKYLKDCVLDKSSIIKELKDKLIDQLISESGYQKLSDGIKAHIEKELTPEAIKALISSHHYTISLMVKTAVESHAEIINKAVVAYLVTGKFAEAIGEKVESLVSHAITNRIIHPDESY